MAQGAGILPPKWEAELQLPALDFDLAQPLLLQALGFMNEQMRSLSLSAFRKIQLIGVIGIRSSRSINVTSDRLTLG